ncbi:MAG TPA: hypothetical protein VJ020_06415, partial [Anaerolineales bacterium]|nr:hypothetical protein [Anaerolineales bacterium]
MFLRAFVPLWLIRLGQQRRLFYQLPIAVLLLAACTIELTEISPAATALPTADANLQLPTSNFQPPPSTIQPPTSTPSPVTPTPLWGKYNLSGSLVYTQGENGILKLDLAANQFTTLLPPNDKMWLSAAVTSPDGGAMLLAYSPPPEDGSIQLGYTGLYHMPADGSAEPQPLLERADPQESYFSPAWTADGAYVYYAHFIPLRDSSGNTFKYQIERIKYPDGTIELIVEDAIWPTPSPDGSKLAYLKIDVQQFTQELYLADLDGGNPTPVLPPDQFPSIDAQFFSPDGKTLVFNAPEVAPTPALSWLDWLTGVRIASAHTVPSDFYSLSLGSDGPPLRLTELYDTGMYGDFSPDGQWIAFISASGIYVMDPLGEEVTPMIPIDAL